MGRIIYIFDVPENENLKIWRYCDFMKFVSLLDKRALFFSRIDKLDDRFEGSFPRTNIELRPAFYNKLFQKDADFFRSMHSVAYEELLKFILVNCWCANEYESAAMWKLYLQSGQGIAIQSTCKRFKNSFPDDLEDDIYFGNVKYIDYSKDKVDEGNFFSRFFHKRKSFEFENEFRALLFKAKEGASGGKADIKRPLFEYGRYTPVNLDVLIENIFVSPSSPSWFYDLIQSVLEKYGINKNVIQSSLNDDPLY